MSRRSVAVLIAFAMAITSASLLAGSASASSQTPIVGQVMKFSVDKRDGTSTRMTAVRTDAGSLVRVQNEGLAKVDPGTRVSVTPVAGAAATPSSVVDESAGLPLATVTVLPAARANGLAAAVRTGPATLGAHTVNLVSALITGQTADAVTTSTMSTAISGDISPYWADSTGSQLTFTAGTATTPTDPYTAWGDLGTCTDAQVIALLNWTSTTAGFSDANPYTATDHAQLYTPMVAACPFAGIGSVSDGGVSWVNGTAPGELLWVTMGHELGHNLGLGHSNARVSCTTSAGDPLPDGTSAKCVDLEYGDGYDIMGNTFGAAPGLLGAAQADALGLIDHSVADVPVDSVTTSQTLPSVSLDGATNVSVLREGNRSYYLQYRTVDGRDAGLGTTRHGAIETLVIPAGVLVQRVDNTTEYAYDSYLLDLSDTSSATCGTAPFALAAGCTTQTASGQWDILTSAADATSATVTIDHYLPAATPAISRILVTENSVTHDLYVFDGKSYTAPSTVTLVWTSAGSTHDVSAYKVMLNGAVYTTVDPGTTTARVTLANGSNKVTVTAVHRTMAASTSAAATIIRDAAAPTFSVAPRANLYRGTVSTSLSIPIVLTWKLADNYGLGRVKAVTYALDGTAKSVDLATTKTAISTSYPAGAAQPRIYGWDYAGRYVAKTAKVPVASLDAAVALAGRSATGWSLPTGTAYLDKRAAKTTKASAWIGAEALSVTSLGFVASMTPTSGRVTIYVDNVKVKTVDLYSATIKHRQLIVAKNWSAAGHHTVVVVAEGTAGRPTALIDGFIALGAQ